MLGYCLRTLLVSPPHKLTEPEILYIQTMRQRIYIDTSVVGGYFDEEFAEVDIPVIMPPAIRHFPTAPSTMNAEFPQWVAAKHHRH